MQSILHISRHFPREKKEKKKTQNKSNYLLLVPFFFFNMPLSHINTSFLHEKNMNSIMLLFYVLKQKQ